MSNGTPEHERRSIRRWPRDTSACEVLEQWAGGDEQSHLYATNLDFRGADLSGLNFYHFFGDRCSFRGVTLRGTGLGGAYLPGCDFSDADMTGAVLAKAQFGGAVFARASLRGANLLDVDAESASFSAADLSEAKIGGWLVGASFRECRLQYVEFVHASLDGADLTNADLTDSSGDLYGTVIVNSVEGVEEMGDAAWFRARGSQVRLRTSP